MSAILSWQTEDSVIILSDGLIYDGLNFVKDIRRKVVASLKAPAAVAVRGNMIWGGIVAAKIIEIIDDFGFDQGLRIVSSCVPEFCTSDPMDTISVIIAGVSETSGTRHMAFCSRPEMGCPAGELRHPGDIYLGIPSDGREVSLSEMGVARAAPGQRFEDYLAVAGVQIFNYFRKVKIAPNAWDADQSDAYLIGGQLDMTIVARDGAMTRTLHRWNDRIGRRVDPFADEPHGERLVGLDRKQRRAAKRAA